MSDHSGEQPTIFDDNYHFGNSEAFPALLLDIDVEEGGVVETDVIVPRSFRSDPAIYERGVRDIARTMSILEGEPVEGVPTTLEVAAADHDPDLDEYTARFSTGSSGIWNNKKQAAEQALRASDGRLPNFLYVTAAGQGGSSGWPPEERDYIRQTGRYVDPDGQPLPSIAMKQGMLDEAGLRVTRISSDADGCSIATAHAVAMEPGQLTHAHLNGAAITGESGKLAAGIAELVNQWDDFWTGRASDDPAELTKEMIAMALEQLPDRPRQVPAQGTKLEQALTTHTPGKLSIVAAGIARRRGEGVHPAVLDTAEMVKTHPEARILFQVVQRAMGEGELRDFMDSLFGRNQLLSGNVSALHMPGTRRMHQAYPTVRESVRNYAFS